MIIFFELTFAYSTVPIYDGRKHLLEVPDDLRNVPDILPRYAGTIPEYSLALVAYTASTYTLTSGPRKDLFNASLNIQYAVVLYEPLMGFVSGDDEADVANE